MYALVNARLWDVEADTVVINSNGVIEKIGWEHSLTSILAGVKRIDVGGATVLPALHESHAHVFVEGKCGVNLRGIHSIGELHNRIASFIARHHPPYIVGRGWDHEYFIERRMPRAEDLDQATGPVPTLIIRVCGHVAVANTALLKLAQSSNILDKLRNYLEFEDGRPTGVVVEEGVSMLRNLLPKPSRKEAVEEVIGLLRTYRDYGVLYLNFMSVTNEILTILKEAIQHVDGINVATYVSLEDTKRHPTLQEDKLVVGVKVFADGSLGGRTAYLREKYSDSDSKGKLLMNSKLLEEVWRLARGMGLKLAVHAIGDGALEEVIKFAERVKPGRTVRIEHASLTPPDIVNGLSNTVRDVVVQPHFLVSDWWAESRLGSRVRWLYAFKTLTGSGLTLHGSSDYPVEPLNPYLGISCVCTRGMLQYVTRMEALNLEDAVHMYLRDPSFGGTTIRIGCRANLVVLDHDIGSIAPYDVAATRPKLVVVSGRVIEVRNNVPSKLPGLQ